MYAGNSTLILIVRVFNITWNNSGFRTMGVEFLHIVYRLQKGIVRVERLLFHVTVGLGLLVIFLQCCCFLAMLISSVRYLDDRIFFYVTYKFVNDHLFLPLFTHITDITYKKKC